MIGAGELPAAEETGHLDASSWKRLASFPSKSLRSS